VASVLATSATLGVAALASAHGSGQAAAAPSVGDLVPFWLVRPAYPQIARSARVQGVVTLALTVGTDGRVESTSVERDIPLLSRAAVEAARDSAFLCRGCSGPMTYRLTYVFEIVELGPADVVPVDDPRLNVSATTAVLPVVTDITTLSDPQGPDRGVKCLFLWRCDPPPTRARAGHCLWLWRCGRYYPSL
jgi:TonB family protein